MWRWLVVLLAGCASTRSTVVLQFPTALPEGAVISTVRFTAAEIDAGVHQQPAQLYTWLERVDRVRDEDAQPETVTFPVDGTASVQVFVDTEGKGLDALFGASTLVLVPAGARVVQAVQLPPVKAPKEPCSGERLQKLVVDGRALCAYLPVAYASEPERRFPVVFAFPGFSGNAVHNDGFGARALFDRFPATPVIVVGVETRIPEGTGYLSGAWDAFVVDRVLPEVDRQLRTDGRRLAFGHSTGGWNALAVGLRHPDCFVAVAASSPDPLDLDVWLRGADGKVEPRWFHWQRAEQRLGGRGQFTSWALAWSGGRPLFADDGTLRAEVLAAWKAQSPMALLGARIPVFVTAGRSDMFKLYAPSLRFVEVAREKNADVMWAPTELDHFGHTEARFAGLVAFLVSKL